MKKSLLLSVVLCGSVTAGALAKNEALDIVFVDSFRAMRECEDGERVGKEIDTLREKASNEIRTSAENLTKADADLKSKASMLKPVELAKQERELDKRKRDLQESVGEKEQEIKMVMQQKTEELAIKIEEGVVAVAKEKGVDAVIDKMTGRVMYTKDNNRGDITAEAIVVINQKSATLAKAGSAPSSTTTAQATAQDKAKTA